MNELTHLDLFSGIGGFAIAAQWAGFRTIGFSEVEPYACRVLAEQFPGVPNFGDVRKRESFAGLGPVTVLTSGYPCQPFSYAGKRGGASDDRHLWPAMRSLIEGVRPAWIIGENVSGHITMGLDVVLSDLATLGYACQPFVIPACGVGAHHKRERVWILANRVCERSERLRDESGESGSAGQGRTDCEADCQLRAVANPAGAGQSGQGESKQRGHTEEAREGETNHAVAVGKHAVWCPEPSVGRVANGVSDRAHRLKGLGNAIVPQVVEPFFHWIGQIEKGELK